MPKSCPKLFGKVSSKTMELFQQMAKSCPKLFSKAVLVIVEITIMEI
jgi:hypothetical protein